MLLPAFFPLEWQSYYHHGRTTIVYRDPLESKDMLTQFKGATVAIASDRRLHYYVLYNLYLKVPCIHLYFSGLLSSSSIITNDYDIPHGFIFATFILASMLGSQFASRLMVKNSPKVETYMQIIFVLASTSLMLPILTTFLVPPSNVKGGGISFAGSIQLLCLCTFEACVGIFWPSIMKMRSQYIPEEARTTIVNFFRIPLNLFIFIVVYNYQRLPHHSGAWLAYANFSYFVSSILQRWLATIVDKPKARDWTAMKERNTEADPLNAP